MTVATLTAMEGQSPRGPREGFAWQDVYTAWVLLRWWAIPGEAIEKLWPEADGAPHVDDLVIKFPTHVVFRQLKHSIDQETCLVASDLFGKKPRTGRSLWSDLVQGWRKVSADVGANRTQVQLVTTMSLSEDRRNVPISPSELRTAIIEPMRTRGAAFSVPSRLERAWNVMMESAAASDEELRQFLISFEIRDNEPGRDELEQRMAQILRDRVLRPESRLHADVGALIELASRLATEQKWRRWVERRDLEDELTRLLGSRGRAERHRLTLPARHVAREELGRAVLDKLNGLDKGYLRVVGPPGSGKTVFSTWLADSHPDAITLRYHAFDPQDGSPFDRAQRVQPFQFATDLLTSLSERFPDEFGPVRPERANERDAIDELWSRLSRLGERGRCIVLIDGIDHAVRDGLAQSFLDMLRPVANVPAGVIFLLVGQPDWPYPPEVSGAPLVELPPFGRGETAEYLGTFEWHDRTQATAAVVDTVQARTEGNPLSVFFTAELLAKADSPKQAWEILDGGPEIGADVRAVYDRLWQDVSKGFVPAGLPRSLGPRLQAFFATARLPVDADALVEAFPGELRRGFAEDVLDSLRPVLREMTSGGYALFHDDLRVYLRDRVDDASKRVAHGQHATIILHRDPPRDVALAAEHLWCAQGTQRLSRLLSDRPLAEWLVLADGARVCKAARLAFAAALVEQDPGRIAATGLFYSRCVRLHPPSWDWDFELRLKGDHSLTALSRVVAPEPHDTSVPALERRVAALAMLHARMDDDPAVARALLARFSVAPEALGSMDSGQLFPEKAYFSLQAVLRIRLGDIGTVRTMLEQSEPENACGIGIAEGLQRVAATDADPDRLDAWLVGLGPKVAVAADELIDAAQHQLRERNAEVARRILRALGERSADLEPATLRRLFVTCAEAGFVLAVDPEVILTAPYYIPDYDDGKWAEPLHGGFVEGYFGRVLDPDEAALPRKFAERLSRGKRDRSRGPSFLWRAGYMSGLLVRRPALVTPKALESLLRQILSEDVPQVGRRSSYEAKRVCGLALPVLVAAACSSADHREAALRLLREVVRASSTDFVMLNLVLRFDVASAGELLAEALVTEELPGSDGSLRAEWFSFWEAAAHRLGRPLGDAFTQRAAIAGLGNVRKDFDPLRRVDALLGRLIAAAPASTRIMPLVRRALNHMRRFDNEDDGSRQVSRNIAKILAHVLTVDPAELRVAFEWATGPDGVASPFGDLPAEIVEVWTRRNPGVLRDAACAELVALFHWIAATRHAVRGHRPEGAVLEQIVAELDARGEGPAAAQCRQWLRAYNAPAAKQSEDPDSDHRRGREEQPLPPLTDDEADDAELSWFYWARDDRPYDRLSRYLAAGAPSRLSRVLRAMAVRVAQTDPSSYLDVEGALDGLLDHLELEEAAIVDVLDEAIDHVAHLATFQARAVPEIPDAPVHESALAPHLVALVARGLRAADGETVVRCTRGLAALSRRPELAPVVRSQLAALLGSSDDRIVAFALCVAVAARPAEGLLREQLSKLCEHPNAGCRLLAHAALDRDVQWEDEAVARITVPSVLVERTRASGARAKAPRSELDEREQVIEVLAALSGAEPSRVSELLAVACASIPPTHDVAHFQAQWAATLPAGVTDNAAGRAATALCAEAPRSAPLLAAVSLGDPWLMTCPPHQDPPEGWIEVGLSAEGWVDGSTRNKRVSCVGAIVPGQPEYTKDLPAEERARRMLGSMRPVRPAEYPWQPLLGVRGIQPPEMEMITAVPLFFWSSVPARGLGWKHDLVPQWWQPFFSGTRFEWDPKPAFFGDDGEAVLVACYRESQVQPPGGSAWDPSPYAFEVSWHAKPGWLQQVARREGLSFVRATLTSSRKVDGAEESAFVWEDSVLPLSGVPACGA